MKIKNNKVFFNTKHHRNNTNINYRSSHKEHYNTIFRKYLTPNNNKTYKNNRKEAKSDVEKIIINKIGITNNNNNNNNNNI